MPHDQQGILSMLMMQRMRALLHSKTLPANEIYTGQILCDRFTLEVVVEWCLVRQSHVEEVVGNQPLERHFGQNVEQFHEYRQSLLEPSQEDEEAHQQFIQELKQKNHSALFDAENIYQHHQLEPFSVQKNCPICSGHGEKKCSSCDGTGQKICYRCHGRGLISKVDALGQHIQTSCDCLYGYHRCIDCKGRGKLYCQECQGKGVFTLNCQVNTVSEPKVSIRVQSPVQEQGLRRYLQQQGIGKCVEWFDFKLWYYKKNRFQYRAESVVLEQHLHFYLKNYIVASFGEENLHIFLRPPMFDDIFSSQVRYLQSPDYQKDLKNYEQMLIIYHQYKEHPILNMVMQQVARNPIEQSQKYVQEACQGFISPEPARILGRELKHLFLYLSPSYHRKTWLNAITIMSISSFIIWHYQMYLVLFQLQASFWGKMLWIWLMILVIVCLKTLQKSCRITKQFSQNIAEQYRQKINHKQPIQWFFLVNGGVLLFCLILAFVAWLFNLQGLHQHRLNEFLFNYGLPHDIFNHVILWLS